MRLGSLGHEAFATRGARYLESMAAAAIDHPFGLGQTVCAADRLVRGSTDVVIVGPKDDAHTLALCWYASLDDWASLPGREPILWRPHCSVLAEIVGEHDTARLVPFDGPAYRTWLASRTDSEKMRGAWAGELGQTQFLASSYERFATDFDGDGRADLIGSATDALASTANYLKGNGWQPGEGFAPGTTNFGVLASWNQSTLVQKTIAAFAKKLAH